MAKGWRPPPAWCSVECERSRHHVAGPRTVELYCFGPLNIEPCAVVACGRTHGHPNADDAPPPSFADLYLGEDEHGSFFRGLPEHTTCAVCDERAWHWFKLRIALCSSCFGELSSIENRRRNDADMVRAHV